MSRTRKNNHSYRVVYKRIEYSPSNQIKILGNKTSGISLKKANITVKDLSESFDSIKFRIVRIKDCEKLENMHRWPEEVKYYE